MKQTVLKHKLNAAPTAGDFDLIELDVPNCPELGILVKVKYISIDPYIGHLPVSYTHLTLPTIYSV